MRAEFVKYIFCFIFIETQITFSFFMPTPDQLAKNKFFTDTAQNADQQSSNVKPELIEGDIQPSRKDVNRRVNLENLTYVEARSGTVADRWDAHWIPYQINYDGIEDGYRLYVKLKLNYVIKVEYKNKVGDCIHFCERRVDCPRGVWTGNYIKIGFTESGCWSVVGREGGGQPLNLAFPGCMSKGTITHELMHAIGFFHEQSRPDRDGFVKIVRTNIETGQVNIKNQLQKLIACD
ncbi:zinc metalloproteinase nas-4 isoform X2 [Eurytemora carolleeae]|uniref:zinc metalloproteinase nas-4 isoform X2 n=1 Tax=Eurytemora carolleeae TaxID=1294199 RepID=UPI000C76578B|nr:zinc metalloproteinase nas-4 isoform X2 [Eurytemora carolleeae]|eukprot:XP_023349620.1 zinc metalloproteinase nas-4-like isoform X2 [Eurytemora affinis]